MPARFETQRIENPPPEEPLKKGSGTLDGGFRGDLTPIETPLNSTDELSDIRFERKGIRKDFGWRTLGGAAASRIIGLIEHKFIENNAQFQRLIRAVRTTGGKLRLEVWDGNSWVTDQTSSEDVPDILLSMVSVQGKILIADGTQILSRAEITPLLPQADDFPPGNSLTEVSDETAATIDLGDAVDDTYQISYSVSVTITSGTGLTLILGFEHNGVEFDSRTYFLESGSLSWPTEILEAVKQIDSGDSLSINIKSIDLNALLDRSAAFSAGVTHLEEATKAEALEAFDDRYSFVYDLTPDQGQVVTVEFYVKKGVVWELLGTEQISVPVVGRVKTFVIDGVGADDQFGIDLEASNGILDGQEVRWEEADVSVVVHGFNEATDMDPLPGVFYNTAGAVGGTFGAIVDAPAARFLFPFGNRVIALRDGSDPQALSWPINGDVTDWTGEGSGGIILIDSRGDPLDDLMAGAALSSNYVAIFRKRSIMRGFLTGNAAQAIGVTHWIEGVGTEFPFSVRIVPGGIIFLGHDYQVYYLTETSFTPIGEPIQQELIEALTSNLEAAEAVYDPIFHEYMLGVPEAGASNMTALWIFDFQLFRETQQLRWRKRPISATRMAAASEV